MRHAKIEKAGNRAALQWFAWLGSRCRLNL
jgi:hypothetical protein